MKNKPTALIIGAGIGGNATAARLANNGFEVAVVEKNEKPGGAAIRSFRMATDSILVPPCF